MILNNVKRYTFVVQTLISHFMKTLAYSLLTFCLGLNLISLNAQTLSEGFENSFPPEDWVVINQGDGNTWIQNSSSSAYEGSHMARINYSTSAHNDWLITPKLSISSPQDSIHFWARNNSSSYQDQFHVKVSTGLQVVSDFTTVIDSFVTPGTTWEKFSYDLSSFSGQDIYIAFQAISTNEYYLFIDEVTGPDLFIPSCTKIDSINLSSVNPTNADFTWPEVVNAQQYYCEVYEEGETPGVSTPIFSSSTLINSITTTGLNSNTAYTLYIRTICSLTDTSDARSVDFNTPCDGVSSLNQTFENLNGSDIPDCWNFINNASSSYGSVKAVTYGSPANGSYHLRLYNGGNSSAQQYLITPMLSDLANGTHRIRFISKNDNNEELVIGTFSDPSDELTFSAVDTISLTGTETEYIYNFIQPTTDQYIGFKMISTGSYNKVYLDNIIWEAAPSCLKTTDIDVLNVSTSAIEISWNNPSMASTFLIEYGEVGFSLGTGVQVQSTDTFTTINGLSSATLYEFYIKSICTIADSSEWSVSYQAQTLCTAVTIIDEDFEGLSDGSLPLCWSKIVDAPSGTPYVKSVSTGSPASGNGQISLYNSFGGIDANLILVSPEWNTLENKRVKFFARGGGQIKLGEMVDPTDLSTFTPIDSVNIVTTQSEYDIILTGSYSGKFLAFKVESPTNNTYNYIDHIRITELPTCIEPVNVVSQIYSQTEVEVSWISNGVETEWLIEYGPTGFTLGSGQTVQATTNPSIVSGLNYGDTLDFYVKALCSSTDSSMYSNHSTQIMQCAPETGNVEEDFITLLPSCWSRAKGVLTSNSTLSADNGGDITSWKQDGYLNNTTSGAARINIYGTNANHWIISRSIKLLPNHNKILEFDAGLTDFGNGNVPDNGSFGDDDKIVVVVSTDNGLSWSSANTIITFDTSNAPSYLGEHYSLDLSMYTGNVKIGFYGESTVSNEDNDFFIDNFRVGDPILMNDIQLFNLDVASSYCIGDDVIPIVTVKNIGEEDITSYEIQVLINGPQTLQFTEVISSTLLMDSTNEVMFSTINNLATGVYTINASVTLSSDSVASNNEMSMVFIVEDDPILTINADQIICAGESVVLNASTMNATILWNGNMANGSVVTPNTTSVYTCEVVNSSGCTVVDSFTVTVNSIPEPSINNINNILYSGEEYDGYTWTYNGVEVSIVDSIIPTANGEYILNVVDGQGCEGLEVYTVSGLNLNEETLEHKIYPNPTKDIVILGNHVTSYRILNIYGQTLRVGNVIDEIVDVSDLLPGNYIIYYMIDGRTYFGKIQKI